MLGREQFDLVYTGIGALCWLPDITRWAETVATLLRPGGRLYLREGHPVLWATDEIAPGRLELKYSYFEQPEPFRFEEAFTYTDGEALAEPVGYEWNHGLGEIVQAVLDAGLTLTRLVEHDEVDWPAYPWMVATGRGALAASRRRDPRPPRIHARSTQTGLSGPGGGGFSGSLSFSSSPGGGIPPELPIQH